MSNKERLDANNAKIEEIRQTLARKQVSPTDMLQARVDATNSCAYLFYQYGGTDLSFIKNLDTSNVTTMEYMIYNCTKLTTIDVSNLNTSNVKRMDFMFKFCKALTSLDVSSFDTSNVIYMGDMFSGCVALTSLDLSNFDTSNVTDMNRMFYNCTNLTSLDLSTFNTSKVTTLSETFGNCKLLTSLILSNFNTSKTTNLSYTFKDCKALTILDLSAFDTSVVTEMPQTFYGDTALEKILGKLNVVKCTNFTNIFANCLNLTDVTLLNIKRSITLGSGTSYGTKLSNATLINTIQQLWDLTGKTSQTLTLSTASKENIANIYVKLVDVTDEMLATDPNAANKKPCVVCESTDDGAMTLTEYATSKKLEHCIKGDIDDRRRINRPE